MERGSSTARAVLFDIDGTLLHAGSLPRRAFGDALREVFGTAGTVADHDFAGKTDLQIAREILEAAGVSPGRIQAALPALMASYLGRLEAGLGDPRARPRVLPGVVELLDALAGRTACALGLVTGNLARGAELKLAAAGLSGRFAFGAFGSDSERRPDLPAVAVRRARALGLRVGATVVVGDTPLDVACGAHAGAWTVGVATGPYDAARLRRAGADVVLPDFADTERALDGILGGGPGPAAGA